MANKDKVWKDCLDKYNMLDNINRDGSVFITAEQIKYSSSDKPEPRLHTKYDFSKDLPKSLKDNNLSILPIDNGTYQVGRFLLYEELPVLKGDKYDEVYFPEHIETADPENVYSEANALHIAIITGMMSDFIGEDVVQTISGRMRTKDFNFLVDALKQDNSKFQLEVKVKSPQLEIDGGYEGEMNVVLIEAKNKQPEDFIVRQLYYPYRHWADKTTKPIKTIFFTYDSGIYRLYEYAFTTKNYYNSLRLTKHKEYIVKYDKTINKLKKTIEDTLPSIIDSDSDIPFPQADSMTRIIETVNLANQQDINYKMVAEEIEYEDRQGKYYIDACRYLGFLEKSERHGYYRISETGKLLCNLPSHKRNMLLFKQMIKHDTFYNYYHDVLINQKDNIKDNAVKFIRRYAKIESDTSKRRASSVVSWLRWAINSKM